MWSAAAAVMYPSLSSLRRDVGTKAPYVCDQQPRAVSQDKTQAAGSSHLIREVQPQIACVGDLVITAS